MHLLAAREMLNQFKLKVKSADSQQGMRLQVKVTFQHSQATDSHRGGLGVFVPRGRYHGALDWQAVGKGSVQSTGYN